MRRPALALTTATAVLMSSVVVGAGVLTVRGGGVPRGEVPVSAMGTAAPVPEFPPRPASLDGLEPRVRQATLEAAERGAQISVVVLDRETGETVSNGNNSPFPIASVAKLFIADDLLLQEAEGRIELSTTDRTALDIMLRSSDDNAAENFWNRNGGSAIITRIVARYGLTGTKTPWDGRWDVTTSTTSDLVRYYDMLLDGSGGLPPEQASIIMGNLAQSTPTGIGGYPQRFGIPEGLYAEPVAVKQGWFCCWNGGNQLHISTGVIGKDRRYVMAIGSLQPTNGSTARETITQAVKTMFPGGRI